MKKRDAFLEEFTNNLSELLVESFFIRYFNDFDEDNLLECISKLQYILNSKIKCNFREKLFDYGYSKKDIEEALI